MEAKQNDSGSVPRSARSIEKSALKTNSVEKRIVTEAEPPRWNWHVEECVRSHADRLEASHAE